MPLRAVKVVVCVHCLFLVIAELAAMVWLSDNLFTC